MTIPELQSMLELKERVRNLTIGRSITWKPFLITYEIYRVADDVYELSHTADGWFSVFVTQDTLIEIVEGRIKLSTLNWQ